MEWVNNENKIVSQTNLHLKCTLVAWRNVFIQKGRQIEFIARKSGFSLEVQFCGQLRLTKYLFKQTHPK